MDNWFDKSSVLQNFITLHEWKQQTYLADHDFLSAPEKYYYFIKN